MKTSVSNKPELLYLLNANSEQLHRYGVSSLGLFGSFVRNDIHASSDIDFLVEFRPGTKTYDNFIGLAYFLEDLFGRRVELLTNQSLSRYLRPHILKEIEYVRIGA